MVKYTLSKISGFILSACMDLIVTVFFSPGALHVFMTLLSVVVPEWIDGINGFIFNCRSFIPVGFYCVFSTGGFRVFTTLLYVVLNDRC